MTAGALDREAALAARVRDLRSGRFVAGFTRYSRWYVGRSFSAVRVHREGLPEVPPGRPVIVYANHPSWWDPLVFLLLAARFFPGRPGFGPMDAAALRNYGFMRRLGIYGVEPRTLDGAATFLFTGAGLLRDPNAMLWVTAEGRFTDVRSRPVILMPGLAGLARRVPDAVLLPLALEYPFWDERFPEALLRFGGAVEASAVAEDTRAGTRALEARLTDSMDRLAAAATTRDPGQFVTLLSGSAGVGGTYDLWRRVKAWSAGRRFTPRHSADRQ